MARSAFSPPALPGSSAGAGPSLARRTGAWHPLDLGVRGDASGPPAESLDAPDQDAFAEARAAGYIEGQRAGAAELQETIDAWIAATEDLTRLRAVLAEAYRRELVELALAAAEAVMQTEVAGGSELTTQLVETALSALGTDEPLRVTVGPNDAERLEAWIAEATHRVPTLTVRVDEALQPGDLRVQSADGTVEALLHQRIERVRKLVLDGEAEGDPT